MCHARRRRPDPAVTGYEKQLERTLFRTLEGPLHECRAALAEGAGDNAARAAALGRARDVYTACGMTPDAERVALEQSS